MRTSLHYIPTTAGAALLLGWLAAPVRADILYVSNWYPPSILTFTPGGVGSVFANASSGSILPRGLAFDSAGNLYVGYVDTIERITPGGVSSVLVNFGSRSALAFDSAGNLYVGTTTNTIEKITPGGVHSVFASTGLNQPQGLAFDNAGNLYVANSGNDTIQKITPSGVSSLFAKPIRVGTGRQIPQGLAFDNAGNLYVATVPATIEKFTPEGVGSVFATTASNTPLAIAFDSAGDLYATDGSSRIEEFTPGGIHSLFADFADVNGPEFLAFTDDNGVPLPLANQRPIPEPATWTLLGLGLPALFGFSRPRRTQCGSSSALACAGLEKYGTRGVGAARERKSLREVARQIFALVKAGPPWGLWG